MPYYISMQCGKTDNREWFRKKFRTVKRRAASGTDVIEGTFRRVDEAAEILGSHDGLFQHTNTLSTEEGLRCLLHEAGLGIGIDDPAVAFMEKDVKLRPVTVGNAFDGFPKCLF